MATYVCQNLVTADGDGVYPAGFQYCSTWVENQNLLDVLAITPAQAGKITLAICSLLALGFVIGEMAGLIKRMGK